MLPLFFRYRRRLTPAQKRQPPARRRVRRDAYAATFFTVIESARRNGLNPYDYLKDVLTRLPSHPINRIDDLLPDRWKPSPKT